jgi:ribosomal protein L44E
MKAYETEAERIEARRRASREWKERNSLRRAGAVYTGRPVPHPKRKHYPTKRDLQRDAWWEALKAKHAGKPRLDKSIKPYTPLPPGRVVGA